MQDRTTSDVLSDIQQERNRQQVAEGYTSDHDDKHADGSLVYGAVCYSLATRADGDTWLEVHNSNGALRVTPRELADSLWPWTRPASAPKATEKRKRLVQAAALLVAEIERMDRIATCPK